MMKGGLRGMTVPALALVVGGCNLVLGFEHATLDTAAAGGGGGIGISTTAGTGGGPLCPMCVDDNDCMTATGCVKNGCLNGKCSACANGIQDGEESDVDCGKSGTLSTASDCPKCDIGKTCVDDADCISGQCDGNRCGSCSDSVKDGAESDVDCGGSVCAKCPESKICFVDFDCAFGRCEIPPPQGASSSSGSGGSPIAGVCNTCNDGFKDGTESALDCGGATCKKCLVGDDCKVDFDCASNMCIGKVCK